MVEIVAKGPVKSRKRKGWKSYYVSTRHREIKKTNGTKGELKWFHTLAEAQAAARQLNAAEKYDISRGRVYRFLKDAVDEGIFLPSNQGVYACTEDALDHQFENLLRLLCNPKTHELYKMLRLSYGLLEAAALQHDNDGYRESNPTTLSRVLKLVDE